MGNLTALHTLGVVNVGVVGGEAFLIKELPKLTQLRKLRLSSMNWKNWKDLCVAVSCQAHLKTLLVRFDDEERHLCRLDDISKPPEKLESLKLYGVNIHVSMGWRNKIYFLRKAHLEDVEVTVSMQEDIDNLLQLQCQDIYRHVCVKPIHTGKLLYGEGDWATLSRASKILKIDCGSCSPKIYFGAGLRDYLEVLVVHCSTIEASLKLFGLDELHKLQEIRLGGLYSDALKQHLQQKIDELPFYRSVVLTLEDV